MKYFCYTILLTLMICACRLNDTPELAHSVMISHPVLNKGKALPYSLVQIKDVNGAPLEYYMDVDSVACGNEVCNIIKVRLFWNALGNYLRLEFPDGGGLTKKDHLVFTQEDYHKLNQILSDTDSALKKFNPDCLAVESNENGVDAVTKPTPLFYQTAVVRGAIYTCYTLWHWVNSDASEQIYSMTAETCSLHHLMQYVENGSVDFYSFALGQFADRAIFEKDVVTAVVKRAQPERTAFLQSAIDYFESAMSCGRKDLYYNALVSFFAKGNSQKRILCLRSLGTIGMNGSTEFYSRMAAFLPDLESYFEVHLLLNLLEKHDPDSDEFICQAQKVLANKNFLIARRAYWFLEKRKLNQQQAELVKAFRVKYKDRL